MKNNYYFLSKSGNAYCYNHNQKILYYIHPLVKYFKMILDKNLNIESFINANKKKEPLNQYNETEINYYYKKSLYFNKTFKDINNYKDDRYNHRIKPDHVKLELANVKQIVFEVTERCNLNCKYCGYGQLYNFYDPRNNTNLNIIKAKTLINYLIKLWNSNIYSSYENSVVFSFYGGEPLLNMEFIKEIIRFIKSLSISKINPVFMMTTNAVDLKKHMDYIVDNNIRLVISLDGSEKNNSYRTFKNDKNSYQYVYNNIKTLQQKHPSFFNDYVAFNAVLHNRNSVSEIFNYFKSTFNKIPYIGELNTMGVNQNKKKVFLRTYKNLVESLHQSEDYLDIKEQMFIGLPELMNLTYFLHQYTGNVYKNYNDFFIRRENKNFLPTGTCAPFSRKLFLTANGKILPCERIGHRYALGSVNENNVELDFKLIAKKYNAYFETITKQCGTCYNKSCCRQCIFYIDNLEENPSCEGYCNESNILNEFSSHISELENNPNYYKRIMSEIVIM